MRLVGLVLVCGLFPGGGAVSCSGWTGTKNCNPDGDIDESLSLPCSAVIEEGRSGFCRCGQEIVSRVPCKHLPFVCADQCELLAMSKAAIDRGLHKIKTHTLLLISACLVPSGPKFVASLASAASTSELFLSAEILVFVPLEAEVDSSAIPASVRTKLVAVNTTADEPHIDLLNAALRGVRDRLHPEHVAMFDCASAGWDPEGIAHTFGLSSPNSASRRMYIEHRFYLEDRLPGWQMACANSVRVNQSHRFHDAASFRNLYFTQHNYRMHERVIHNPLDTPEEVEACYGGLAVWQPHQLKHCQFAKGTAPAEHVSFINCLRSKNELRIVFNPRMLVYY